MGTRRGLKHGVGNFKNTFGLFQAWMDAIPELCKKDNLNVNHNLGIRNRMFKIFFLLGNFLQLHEV
jgi:hypothetical protein